MKIQRFVVAVLFAAILLVGVAHVSKRWDGRSSPGAEAASVPPPVHAFIPAVSSTGDRITCPVGSAFDIHDVFSQPPSPCWLVDGWSSARDWGRWVKRPVARFEVQLEKPEDRELVLRAKAPPRLPPDTRQSFDISVNGRVLATRTLEQNYLDIRIPIPGDALRRGRNEFSLAFEHLVPAVKDENGRVDISKAAGLGGITLMDPTAAHIDSAEKITVTDTWDDSKRAMVVEQAGSLVLPVFVPPGAKYLDMDLRAVLDEDHDGARVRVAMEGFGGIPNRTTTLEIPPARSLTLVRLPVQDLGGGWSLATVSHDALPFELEVSQPRFDGGGIGGRRHHRRDRSDFSRPPPDVVWITLDAARADHFGFAGYHRDTSPFIDSLARESLVFPNAYSLVPYTVCSVPTMLSGLSFLDHRVVGPEDVLSPEVNTLAEILGDAGYLTAAFTATPNNSSAKGFHQGYEVFREMWTEAESSVSRRAPFIAGKVVEWLETVEGDNRPLHLQVHIIPPHEPYDPPPEFDRYTDPGYDGPCDGWAKTNFELSNGILDPTSECIDHVTGLYDGNLNVADEAVRTIVEALSRRPNWENTVLLVTSDHGEAFMEHGQIGHNTTLYTEMMHVPFILRLPGTVDARGIDTDGLVTLADLVPTLLHAAGVERPKLTDGTDLLDPTADRNHRFMVARTSQLRATLGLRTLRWNLMVSSSGSAVLYDLATDPDERASVSAERPDVFMGLGRILTTRLDVPPRLRAPQAGDLDDEERELLETLGYIRD